MFPCSFGLSGASCMQATGLMSFSSCLFVGGHGVPATNSHLTTAVARARAGPAHSCLSATCLGRPPRLGSPRGEVLAVLEERASLRSSMWGWLITHPPLMYPFASGSNSQEHTRSQLVSEVVQGAEPQSRAICWSDGSRLWFSEVSGSSSPRRHRIPGLETLLQ